MKKHFVIVAALLLAFLFPVSAVAQNSFSGRATVVNANVLGNPIVLSDTGALPSSGGAQQASLLTASVPGLLTANVLHATAIAGGNESRSEASAADLNLTVAGHTITAAFLMARANAVCSNGRATTSAESEIAALTIDNQSIHVGTEPNQTVPLPGGGGVILNEQSGSNGSTTVNALHVVVPGVADVVISSAHADITCAGPPPCSANDFVTSGGWIPVGGSKANFAVAGGIKHGDFWGHLEYHDKAAGIKVHGTGVTAYTVTGPNSRHIGGTADLNGSAITYDVDVTDNGEPGAGSDTFFIRLSTGYTAGGKLGGGNIQLHNVGCN